MTSDVFRLSDLVTVERDGETGDGVLVDGRSGQIFSCNHSAAAVVEALGSKVSFGQMVERICGEYDVTRSVAERDLREFLNSLGAAKLLAKVSEEQQDSVAG